MTALVTLLTSWIRQSSHSFITGLSHARHSCTSLNSRIRVPCHILYFLSQISFWIEILLFSPLSLCNSSHRSLSVLSRVYKLPWQPQAMLDKPLFVVIDYSECTDGHMPIGIDSRRAFQSVFHANCFSRLLPPAHRMGLVFCMVHSL